MKCDFIIQMQQPCCLRYSFSPHKYHKLSGLKNRNLLSQSLKLEIQDEGVSGPMHPLKALGKDLFQASLLASGNSLAHGSITILLCVLPVYMSLCPNFLFI